MRAVHEWDIAKEKVGAMNGSAAIKCRGFFRVGVDGKGLVGLDAVGGGGSSGSEIDMSILHRDLGRESHQSVWSHTKLGGYTELPGPVSR